MNNNAFLFIMTVQLACFTILGHIIISDSHSFCLISPFLFLIPILILFRNSLRRSTSILTLTQLGLILFFVAKSTYKDFHTVVVDANTASFLKKIGGNDKKDIQAIAIDVSSPGSNKVSHYECALDKTNNYV